MSLQFRFPDYAWLVESTEFGQFLDLAFANDRGEVWLYNNDLQMLLQGEPFEHLYLNRVCGSLRSNVSAVKILLHPGLVDAGDLEGSLKRVPGLSSRLSQMARQNGKERLKRFWFGVADPNALPQAVVGTIAKDDNWVLYARQAELDSGVAMLRHRYFPFEVHGSDRRFAIVWILQQYPALREQLKKAFLPLFVSNTNLHRVEVTSLRPFEYRLGPLATAAGVPLTNPESISLSLGDQADVAMIAALPEEMAAIRDALPDATKKIPLHPEYEYTTLPGRPEPKRIVLTSVGEQGSIPAAIRTWDLVQRWHPKHVILVGVCGGDPDDDSHALGDVVIANWIIGYEHQKLEAGEMKPHWTRYSADQVLLRAAVGLRNGKSWPREYSSAPGGRTIRVKVHDDLAIASGNKLIATRGFLAELRKHSRKIKAVEMEADGVGCACEKAPIKVNVLVIKGIMDKSDPATRETPPAEREAWMRFAARVAADFALDVVRSM